MTASIVQSLRLEVSDLGYCHIIKNSHTNSTPETCFMKFCLLKSSPTKVWHVLCKSLKSSHLNRNTSNQLIIHFSFKFYNNSLPPPFFISWVSLYLSPTRVPNTTRMKIIFFCKRYSSQTNKILIVISV